MKNSKFKIQNLLFVVILVQFLFACNKAETSLLESNQANGKNNARMAGNEKSDSLDYYLNLDLPTRDVIEYVKKGGRLPDTKFLRDYRHLMKGGKNIDEETENYCEGGIFVFQYPGVPCSGGGTASSRLGSNTNNGASNILNCFCYPPLDDPWQNKIHAVATYGSDDRQGYYVYLPNGFNANTKVVVLIHGGGWTTGPDINQVNGWGSTYTPSNPETNNIVRNLITQGYAVVSVVYRLVQYGNNTTEILANTVTINDQIDDIEAAIEHVHTNFPNCLGINANNIQVLGESAGAHLALMFAYTRANTDYIKSVVSVAGPTNMNQMADWVKNKPKLFTCGTDFKMADPVPNAAHTHFPFYGIVDPIANAQKNIITSTVNPLTCTVANIDLLTGFWFGLPVYTTVSSSANNTDKKITDSYNLAQSCVKQVITNPLTHSAFQNISPCNTLVSTRIIPTFIIHGTSDWFVPYSKATNGMSTRLSSTGGLIGTYNTNGTGSGATIPTSSYYSTASNKHIIKLFTNSNHDVANHAQTQPDILTWFNGH